MSSDLSTTDIVLISVSAALLLFLIGGSFYLWSVKKEKKKLAKKVKKAEAKEKKAKLKPSIEVVDNSDKKDDQVILQASELQTIQVRQEPLYEDPSSLKSKNFNSFKGPPPIIPQTTDQQQVLKDNNLETVKAQIQPKVESVFVSNDPPSPSDLPQSDKLYWFNRLNSPPSYSKADRPSSQLVSQEYAQVNKPRSPETPENYATTNFQQNINQDYNQNHLPHQVAQAEAFDNYDPREHVVPRLPPKPIQREPYQDSGTLKHFSRYPPFGNQASRTISSNQRRESASPRVQRSYQQRKSLPSQHYSPQNLEYLRKNQPIPPPRNSYVGQSNNINYHSHMNVAASDSHGYTHYPPGERHPSHPQNLKGSGYSHQYNTSHSTTRQDAQGYQSPPPAARLSRY